jgi:hypothetical protein
MHFVLVIVYLTHPLLSRIILYLIHLLRVLNPLQCCYRVYRARSALFDCRCITDLSVLKYNSAEPKYDPNFVLDELFDTFWMSETKNDAEIRFEFRKRERVSEIFILASTFSSSPKSVSVYTVVDKASKKFEPLVEDRELPLLKGYRWHRIDVKPVLSKYFKVSFNDNYGHKESIAVRQIRFLRCKESK